MSNVVNILALVGVLGIGSQWLAWRFNLPAIVLMSVSGIVAGPFLGLIQPEANFGEFLRPMVSVAVAIILFEGGLSLNFKEISGVGRSVRRMVFPGAAIAWGLGALAGHYAAGLSWPVAILFAGLLVVTGPTVIIPLLRQANLSARPRTVLKWEGIINDPIGALLAVLVFEYVISAAEGGGIGQTLGLLAFACVVAVGIGVTMGLAVAYVFPRGLVPDFLKSPALFTAVLLCFGTAEAIEHETGLLAVTAMGIYLANARIASLPELRRFKENMTIILVSGVFVILCASLTKADFLSADWRMLAFVLATLFLVRPIGVFLSTIGTELNWREKLLIGWIAPRGIVAVALSGLFASRLQEIGYADAGRLVPLTFAIVFATVVAHGFTAKPLARALGIAASAKPGVLIVGSSRWSVTLAKLLEELDIKALVADTSWHRLRPARQGNVATYYGEILAEATEHHVDTEAYGTLLAVTGNEAYNALVCREFAHEIGRTNVYQLGKTDEDHPHGIGFTVRGQTLFRSGAALDELQRRQFAGWRFQKTKLTEEYTYERYIADKHEDAEILMVLKKSGKLAFSTAKEGRPRMEPGDLVIAYTPPAPTKEAAASKAQPAAKPASLPG
ncbi:MAG: cation:proton antiporter [Sphingomonadales bacterium]